MKKPEQVKAAFTAKVLGRVQGVGFRYSVLMEAERLSLSGWVRNTSDGGVEVWAEGSPESLDRFGAWLRRGPPLSRVDSVKKDIAAPAGYTDFGVKY
ncbi:MAG: acylphosphatase [Treponema sp.]|nr:acylphosphatase [Treponema sp.]